MSWLLPVPPSKTEVHFRLHQDEFIAVASFQTNEYHQANISSGHLPRNELYADALIDDADELVYKLENGSSQNVMIEFIVDNCFLPLVFIENDNLTQYFKDHPFDHEKYIYKKIRPQWYIIRSYSMNWLCKYQRYSQASMRQL